MITIIDYNAGNLGSIKNMLKKIGCNSIISSQKKDILNAKKLILPGVGSFDYGMKMLKKHDLIGVMNEKIYVEKTPILGICLGAQLFCKNSEEGTEEGLGWVNGKVREFPKSKIKRQFPVPHIGWDFVKPNTKSKLFKNISDEMKFYFVHSYYIKIQDPNIAVTSNNYGLQFDSAFEKENIAGVQFHPEKSHKFGMQLFSNFNKYY